MAATLHADGFYYDYFAALNQEQQEVNAAYIANYFRVAGWSDNAIAAMLGNLQAESAMNPARWEGNTDWRAQGVNSKGFGLAQWTPWKKYTKWCEDKGLEEYHIETGCLRIYTEFISPSDLGGDYGGGQYYSTSEFPISRLEFIVSTESASELAKVFVRNYERPASVLWDEDSETYEEHLAKKEASYNNRANMAERWFEFLGGTLPQPPTPPPTKNRRLSKLLLYEG